MAGTEEDRATAGGETGGEDTAQRVQGLGEGASVRKRFRRVLSEVSASQAGGSFSLYLHRASDALSSLKWL